MHTPNTAKEAALSLICPATYSALMHSLQNGPLHRHTDAVVTIT